jgi:CheY-specific phosphatase CheX
MTAQSQISVPEPLLTSVVSRVFATMFFAESESRGEAPADPELLWISVGFHGTTSGEVRIGVSPAIARSFAADFLGVEPDELDEGSLDLVLCELGNVVCGAALSAWHPDALLQIAPPQRCSVCPASSASLWTYEVQGSPVQIDIVSGT